MCEYNVYMYCTLGEKKVHPFKILSFYKSRHKKLAKLHQIAESMWKTK